MGLHVTERGDAGAPLAVLLHSDGLTGADLFDLLGLAVPGYRCLAPDRTNYGDSPRSTAGASGRSQGGVPEVALVEDDADAVADLLDGGGHLFGYSYGGVVALAVAARHPERVRSLALLEPPAFQVAPGDGDVRVTRDRIEAALAGAAGADPLDYWRAFTAGAFVESPVPAEAMPLDRIEASRREQVPWDPELDLARIRAADIPTLVVSGDWDPGFSATCRHLADDLGGRLLQLEDADHFFLPHLGTIAGALEAFWGEVDGNA